MEGNLCVQRFSSAEGGSEQTSNLGRHGLPNSIFGFAITEDLKSGYLYEIDHKHLPPKSPNQLKAVRVVMLAEKHELNVSVRFPSSYALRTYFKYREVVTFQSTRKYPDLDEQFVMGLRLAKEVLIRQILPPELKEQGRLQSFWMVPRNITEISTSNVETSNDGVRGSTLNSHGLLTWGVRRRITFVKRNEEKTTAPRVPSFSSLVKEEDDYADSDMNSTDYETRTIVTRKRKSGSCRNKKKTSSKVSKHEKKPGNNIIKRQKLKLAYGRWSRDRYKNAEVKMLEIMKEMGAVYGKPMLRPTLRLEARKHIGDTGLLDHLLKHMAGKVAPNGIDRFRRRHNADGAMEYWLESADLVDLRKEAGVNDPYWTPPAGWKPGDSLSQDPNTAREITMLKEEIASMKRDMQEVITWKKSAEENDDKAIVPYTKSSSAISILESNDRAISHPAVEGYENMLKRKLELEEEMAQLSGALKLLEEEKKKEEKMVEEGNASDCVILEGTAENDKKDVEMEEAAETKEARRERLRSGFRICKPQGTFLWPNMGCSAGNNSGTTSADTSNIWSPHQVLVQQVDSSNIVPMVPTPPSVSSATTSPPSFLIPSPPSSSQSLPSVTFATTTASYPNPTVKLPFATVTNITQSSSTITSTCEQGDNLNILQGYCGTPTSCFPISRPFLLSTTNVASVAGSRTPSTARTYQRKHYHHQQQTQNQQDAAYYRRNWLALATPTTSIPQ